MFDFLNIINKNKFILVAGFIITLILVFYLGYVYGQKDTKELSTIPRVTTVLSNGNKENSLSQIKIRDIIGTTDSKTRTPFGKFYYIVKDDGSITTSDLLFKLEGIPNKITNGKAEKEIPQEMNIDLAIKTSEGQNFVYENIGKAKFSINEKKQLKLDFSAVIDFPLDQKTDKVVQRIVFRPINPDQNSIFLDKDPNLPIKVRGDQSLGITGESSPYFWIDI
jgi:hypothetical protein